MFPAFAEERKGRIEKMESKRKSSIVFIKTS
jgi:hypothetical protein